MLRLAEVHLLHLLNRDVFELYIMCQCMFSEPKRAMAICLLRLILMMSALTIEGSNVS